MSGAHDSDGDHTLGVNPSSPTAVAPTTVAGRYQILGLLGVGGMGSVYRARDTELDETVALKILRRELVALPGMLDRFKREVKLARRVTHKNVARTFDIGEHEGEKYLTMELVEGEPLTALLERHGKLPVAKIVELAGPICDGLAAAHKAGVVHRDLKPDNVLIAKDGRVVITDFGIARGFDAGSPMATMGEALGTPAYMAPEQVDGGAEVDARADLYALGIILFEMATATRPWTTGSALTIAMARLTSDPPDPRSLRADLPDGLAEIIRRCLARKPEGRFADAAEVGAALSSITRPGGSGRLPTPTSAPAPIPSVGLKSVAVLPFRNGGPPEDDYLADGLTDDLIDTLSMVRGLRVRSRGGLANVKIADRDPRELGRELDVQVVVDGSIRRAAGGLLRIATRVVSVADGFQLWARRFDRPAGEVLQVGDEAAQAIADALTVDAAPKRAASADPEAVDLYLRGRHELHQFGNEPVIRAVDLLERALARAPDDAMILATYAFARARLSFFGGPEARRSVDLARSAAARAAAAAPDRAEPQIALGNVLFQTGDPAGAARHFRRGLKISPSIVEGHDILGRIYTEVGRLDDGEHHLNTALTLDPHMPTVLAELSRIYALRGQWDRVTAMLARAGGSPEGRLIWQMEVRLSTWRRDEQEVRKILATKTTEEPPWITALRVMVEQRMVPLPLIKQIAAFEVDDSSDVGRRRIAFWWQLVAEANSLIDDTPAMLEAITRSIDAGLIDLAWIDLCPCLTEARKQPGFPTLRARVVERVTPILAALDEKL